MCSIDDTNAVRVARAQNVGNPQLDHSQLQYHYRVEFLKPSMQDSATSSPCSFSIFPEVERADFCLVPACVYAIVVNAILESPASLFRLKYSWCML